ncbi:MAG: glycosidase, partial [Anaerolineae bacterium]|nr:glycosidase [Anaerolineae bacterium]
TDKGWLLIYHGVHENRVYRAGAALLDLEVPWKVVARTPEPILEPEEAYEREGDVPNVVFPEGVAVVGEELLVFYGGADKVCCAASVNLGELVDYLLQGAMR